jgi:integrase
MLNQEQKLTTRGEMASIHRIKREPKQGRPRQSWLVKWRDPSRRQRTKTFRKQEDAKRFARSVETAMKDKNNYVDPKRGKVTMNEWAKKWLTTVRGKPRTPGDKRSLVQSRVLPAFGNRQLSTVTFSDVQAWVNSMVDEGLSPSRTRQALLTLRQMYQVAMRDGIVGSNPTEGVKLPKLEHREAAYFEAEVVDRITAAMPEPYVMLIRVLGILGLRWGEATALRRRHVDLLRRRLRLEASLSEVSGRIEFGPTKSHAVRSVPLSPGFVIALTKYLDEHVEADPEALLFTGPKGGPLRYRYFVPKVWKPALQKLDLPIVGVHALRHSAAARLISAGASPKALQSILGHRSAAFSLTVYGHLFESDLDDLASKLDGEAVAL